MPTPFTRGNIQVAAELMRITPDPALRKLTVDLERSASSMKPIISKREMNADPIQRTTHSSSNGVDENLTSHCKSQLD